MMIAGLAALKRGLMGGGTADAKVIEPTLFNHGKIMLPDRRVSADYEYDELRRLVSKAKFDESVSATDRDEKNSLSTERVATVWKCDEFARVVDVTEYHQSLRS